MCVAGTVSAAAAAAAARFQQQNGDKWEGKASLLLENARMMNSRSH